MRHTDGPANIVTAGMTLSHFFFIKLFVTKPKLYCKKILLLAGWEGISDAIGAVCVSRNLT